MTEQRIVSKCSDCLGEIVFSGKNTLARCKYCGAPNALPKQPEQIKNLIYANELRSYGEFDEAMQAYQRVLEESPNEVEARWGRLLSKYGVIYVEDKEKQECHITCRRSVRSSFQSEHDFGELLKLAEPEIREKYEKDAKYIDLVQNRIRELHTKDERYDVFLCYKETDDHGARTEDSLRMQAIYNELTREGYRVFFARETLIEKTGADYEAAIFAAIERSRVMLVMGTRKEYFEATWVRSEWRRFLEKADGGDDKVLLPLFRDERDFPEEFIHRHIQGYKMEGPYLLDVKSRLVKLLKAEDKRFSLAKVFLQVGEFKKADEKLDEMLQDAPTNAQIWLYKAMATEEIKEEADFLKVRRRLDENSSFMAAMKFSAEAGKEKLREYLEASEKNAREAEQNGENQSPEIFMDMPPEPPVSKEWESAMDGLDDEEKAQVEEALKKAREFHRKKDYAHALEQYRVAAELGSADAQNMIGRYHSEGFGVQKNDAEAVKWFRKAAEQGLPVAQYNLGRKYLFGGGVEVNDLEAVKWFREAAERGHAAGQAYLGYCYRNEYGVKKNDAEAVKWFRKAAQQGNAAGQTWLGYCYQEGLLDVSKEEGLLRAAELFKRSAQQGDADGQYKLGECYRYGWGVEKNQVEAEIWYQKAAAGGDARALKELDKMKKEKRWGWLRR